MGLEKCTYCDGVTVIKAKNMNDIQDAICDLERDAAEVPQLFAGALNGTAEGGAVTLRDVSPVEHEVSAAVKRKNLLSVGTVVVNEYKELIKRTDTPLPAGIYTFSTTVTESTDTDDTRCFIYWELEDGSATGQLFERNKRISVTFTASLPIKYLAVYAGVNYVKSVGDTATYVDCQLEEGPVATPYEPFIENPTEAKLLVQGKNWFDCANAEQHGVIRASIAERSANSITVKQGAGWNRWQGVVFALPDSLIGKTITVSGSMTPSASNTGAIRVQWMKDYNGTTSSSGIIVYHNKSGGSTSGVVIEKPSDAVFLGIIFYSDTDSTFGVEGDTVTYSNVQVELGTTATPFEPYQTPVEYEQGEAIPSVSPVMTVTTDTPGALVSVEYNRDINAAFETLTKAIISLGGNV